MIPGLYFSLIGELFAASRLWVDAIIDPAETRRVISLGIDAANNSIIKEKYNPGIIQT